MRPLRLPLFVASLVLLAFVGSGCAKGADKGPAAPASSRPRALSVVGGGEGPQEIEPVALRAVPLADVPAGSLGPRLVQVGGTSVVVWAEETKGGSALLSVHAGASREPSAPLSVAQFEDSPRQLVLAGSAEVGVACVLVRGLGARDRVEVVLLGTEGETRTEALLVAEAPGAILWTDVFATAQGFVVLWAERASRAVEIYSATVADGRVTRPERLAQGAQSWQATQGSAGLSLVTAEGEGRATIVLRQLGDQGKPLAAPVVLARDVRGGFDLDLAMAGQRIVAAYSERDGLESRLSLVETDASGNLTASPRFLGEAQGSQALLRLIGSGTGEVDVVWEQVGRSTLKERQYRVLRLSADAREVAFELKKQGTDALLPTFGRSGERLYALTEGASCQKPCTSDASAGPALIQFGREGAFTRPLRDERGRPLTMVWDLKCSDSECLFLGASAGTPSTVALYRTTPLKQGESALATQVDFSPPRVKSDRAIAVVPELAALVGGMASPGQVWMSWLSYFDPEQPYVVPSEPAPDGRKAPVRAQLKTFGVKSENPSIFGDWFVSYRARSLGGLDWVPPKDGVSLLVWAALDNDKPQLFATLQRDRRKIQQKMLTRTEGEILQVSAVRADSGYLVVWVNEKPDEAQIYALRVDANLSPSGPPIQVTRGARSPTDLDLAIHEGRAVLVFADQGAGGTGQADLYAIALDPKTGKPATSEVLLLQSEGHDHSPNLVFVPETQDFQLAWVESPVLGQNSEAPISGRLLLSRVSSEGTLSQPIRSLSIEGEPQSCDLSCSAGTCRTVAVVENRSGQLELWAAKFRGEEALGRSLLPLRTDIAAAVVPRLVGDDIYYSDFDGGRGEWLLRRAAVHWD